MEIIVTVISLLWTATGALAYMLVRNSFINQFASSPGKEACPRKDRIGWTVACLSCGPFALIAAVIALTVERDWLYALNMKTD